ncbi:MAG: HlyD family efflux transporter periplasmic adaptor subunit [Scytonema sp. PMC 1069.18]|nr:HlyD family efflux transporter periplasmic adaptor subunit [Scytonema sp. PMC 1069.18]MEC4882576.1 HlyD family efflux transporter periplasmic adaptor subunit [Scytonema sp. PMC 1070.18]
MVTIPDTKQFLSETDNKQNTTIKDNTQFLRPVSSEEFIPSTSHWISLTGFVLTGTIAIAVTMASVIKYNVTVKANASIRPSGELRIVQPEIEGTVQKIFVKENQNVKQGQAIAKLDDTQQQIKKSQLQSSLQQSILQIVQIDAQIQALNTQIVAEEQSNTRGIAAGKADLVRNQREHEDRKIITQTELLAAEAQLQKEQADLQRVRADLEFAQVEKKRYQILVSEGAISSIELDKKLLAVKQAKAAVVSVQKVVAIAIARKKAAQTAINPSDATVDIAFQRIAQEKAKGEATIAILKKEKQALIQRRVETENQLRQTQKELKQVETQLQKSIIRATSEGIILKLNLRNSGQVLRPGEAIAQIIPQNTPLVVKAMVPTAEIQKVAVGQKVQLRVESCSYPDYGTLKGFVSSVSPDVITPQSSDTGSITPQSRTTTTGYFEATIQPESLSFGNGNRQCNIQAGMEAKADIISREETPMQFLLRKARLIADF